MQKLLLRNKHFLFFISIVVLLGLILGIIYYFFLDQSVQSNIISTVTNVQNFHYNFIFKDLISMSCLLVTSFFIIGLPFNIFYLFYESFVIGFLITIFFLSFGLTGLFYILIFIIINKLLSLILKIIFLKKTINISRYILGLIIYKREDSLKKKIFINFRISLYLIVIILILNILLYFLSQVLFTIS